LPPELFGYRRLAPVVSRGTPVDGPTLLVLAVLGLISLVLVMGEKLASDVEQFFTTWIGVFQRLRDLIRRHPSSNEHDSEEGDH
jgi:hypothetical protein